MTHEEILSMLGDYVDYLIANSSAEAPMWNIEKVRSGKPNKWNYIDGCMITACLSLYKTTGDEKYLKFSKDFIDWFVQEDGSIKTYDPKEYNLDNVNQGKNLFILYDIFGDEKYRKAFDPDAKEGQAAMADNRPLVKKLAIYAENVKNIELHNVKIEGYEGERLRFANVGHFEED